VTIFVLLTAQIVRDHPELAGRLCYSSQKAVGELHRLDIMRAQPKGTSTGSSEAYCGAYADRLVIQGIALVRPPCNFCEVRESQRLREGLAA